MYSFIHFMYIYICTYIYIHIYIHRQSNGDRALAQRHARLAECVHPGRGPLPSETRSCRAGFRVQGAGFRVQGSEFRVQGSG